MKKEEGDLKKDTLLPGTITQDGRRKFRVYIEKYRSNSVKSQEDFYKSVISALSLERMESYGDCKTDSLAVVSRYLLNMALCENLYQPLQSCEIALRNAIHRYLSSLFKTESWFDSNAFLLTDWAALQVENAKKKIRNNKKPLTAGRLVAELHFGFWTSFFEAHYEQKTSFLPKGIKQVFPYLPKEKHRRKEIKSNLERIRILRNRVFHHERIIHWKDLDEQYHLILDVIGYINPELYHLAEYSNRYISTRKAGLTPWLTHLKSHWSELEGTEI
ncbi:MAG: Abi family protein [Spirochaetes bacterium]|nr:Abi family protein [Spirochaetota bacterium]MBN2769702.1 Abi family protein [Spirochaetota bacterium]